MGLRREMASGKDTDNIHKVGIRSGQLYTGVTRS